MDKISVIVPIYNVEEYLDECIQSIINQTYEDLEIILVDDGSKDKSLEIAKKYEKIDSRIRLFSKGNGGLSDARNYGLDRASGAYIGFVDGDDFLEEDMFNHLHEIIKDSDISVCGIQKTSEGKIEETLKVSTYTKDEIFKEVILDRLSSNMVNKLFKRDLFKNLRFTRGIHFEDLDLFYLLVDKATKVSISNKKLYNYRINRQGSITSSKTNGIFNGICLARIYRKKTKFAFKNNISYKSEIIKMSIKYNTDIYRVVKKSDLYKEDIDEIISYIKYYYKDIMASGCDILKKFFTFLIYHNLY